MSFFQFKAVLSSQPYSYPNQSLCTNFNIMSVIYIGYIFYFKCESYRGTEGVVSRREHTINTSNSSIARNGASVISWRERAKHNVEKDRSPPVQTSKNKWGNFLLQCCSVNLFSVNIEAKASYQTQGIFPRYNILHSFTIWITDKVSYIHSLSRQLNYESDIWSLFKKLGQQHSLAY